MATMTPASILVFSAVLAATLCCESAPGATAASACATSLDGDHCSDLDDMEDPSLGDEVVLLQMSHTLQRSVGSLAASAEPQNSQNSSSVGAPGANGTLSASGEEPVEAESAPGATAALLNASLSQGSMQLAHGNATPADELQPSSSSDMSAVERSAEKTQDTAAAPLNASLLQESIQLVSGNGSSSEEIQPLGSADKAAANTSDDQEQEEVSFKPAVSSIAARVIEIVASKVYLAKSGPGAGGVLLLMFTAGVWLFVMVECCKGGIHWGNPPPEEPELLTPPKPVARTVQSDVAEVARRASERQARQARNPACC